MGTLDIFPPHHFSIMTKTIYRSSPGQLRPTGAKLTGSKLIGSKLARRQVMAVLGGDDGDDDNVDSISVDLDPRVIIDETDFDDIDDDNVDSISIDLDPRDIISETDFDDTDDDDVVPAPTDSGVVETRLARADEIDVIDDE